MGNWRGRHSGLLGGRDRGAGVAAPTSPSSGPVRCASWWRTRRSFVERSGARSRHDPRLRRRDGLQPFTRLEHCLLEIVIAPVRASGLVRSSSSVRAIVAASSAALDANASGPLIADQTVEPTIQH
jgi:hypothetical protein